MTRDFLNVCSSTKDLTLEKAISMARPSEEIKRQRTSLGSDACAKESRSVDRVAFKSKQQHRKKSSAQKDRGNQRTPRKDPPCIK